MEYQLEELVPIVKELSEKYTSKESTSITYELAQQLMEAVIYCINQNEDIENNNSNTLLNTNTKINAKDAYNLGYNIAFNKVTKSIQIYDNIINSFNDYDNITYHDTVVLGMPSFFKYYDIKFNPQDHLLTLDYPILIDINDKCGINIIYSYLNCIQLEQTFLNSLPESFTKKILHLYSKNYKSLFINICSIVLRYMLISLVCNKNISNYSYSEDNFEQIKNFLKNKNKDDLEMKLENILKNIIETKYENNQMLYNYLLKDIKNFSTELLNAYKNDNIRNLFALN